SWTCAADVIGAFYAPAHGVIENENPVRTQGGPEEGFGGRIVDVAHFLVVVEIPHGRGMADQSKALAIEGETVGHRAAVEYRHLMGFGQRGRFRLTGRRVQ